MAERRQKEKNHKLYILFVIFAVKEKGETMRKS